MFLVPACIDFGRRVNILDIYYLLQPWILWFPLFKWKDLEGLRLLEIWSGGGFRRIEAIWDLCAWWIMEDWGYQAVFNTRWKWRIEVTCRYSKNEKKDYGGSRLHAGLAKMPKWIMEDLGYCMLFCYCTMYSHFHFLWVGSKNMFLYIHKFW